ncbi:Netrin receptor unc-5 [Pseudolycoriella hygida]|uniref:Netrin receptor UNC5 n=1 Tax=Pseudolycoriella hygida TaxID=35572 RepID=A0A9Q0N594_9DIPT|nr:Netrin receptor unc-5 [Pseudolycoriella hygida]
MEEDVCYAEMQPEYFHDPDKKTLQFQPDLTQNNHAANYEYPPLNPHNGHLPIGQNIPMKISRSISEHHYDVPHLATNYATPVDKVSGNDSYSSSNYSKRIHSTDSLATTTNTSDSTYDVATEPPTLPMSHKTFPKSNTVRQVVTSTGGWLKLNNACVALSIPETAVSKNQRHSVFLSVLNDENLKISIPAICSHISPIIHCGPVDVGLSKPAVLRIPHCAEKLDQWRVSLYYSNAHIQESEPKWRKLVTLGEETINTPAYVQMDDSYAFVMTDFLGRFAIVGESLSTGIGAMKRLKLFCFGPSMQPASDSTIRVYVIEDLPSSKDHCTYLESKLGGVFLCQSTPFMFQDSGHDLNLGIKCDGGWRPKSGAENQTIPFSHVWNNGMALHCAFTIERSEQDSHGLRIDVSARQRQGGEVTATHFTPSLLPFDLPTVDEMYSDGSVKSVTVSNKGVNTVQDTEVAFKLTRQAKRELCSCLDPPTNRGNDWRMLAQKLGVDRYIAYFATKPSPTEQILDLWECRNRDNNDLVKLTVFLRNMGRLDAVEILERTLGPSWLQW